MKKTSLVLGLLVALSISTIAQNKTDISLKWKDRDNQETVIESETGN
jgi:hypothetical protein